MNNQSTNTNNQLTTTINDSALEQLGDYGGCVVGVIHTNGEIENEIQTFSKSEIPSKETAISFLTDYLNRGEVDSPITEEDFTSVLLEMYARDMERHVGPSDSSTHVIAILIAALLETTFWIGAADMNNDCGHVEACTKEEFDNWAKGFSEDVSSGALEINKDCSTQYH